MLDDVATVPFIARYRKEVTGAVDDAQLRALAERLRYLLEERHTISSTRSVNRTSGGALRRRRKADRRCGLRAQRHLFDPGRTQSYAIIGFRLVCDRP
jgi:protein Tex